MKSKTKAAKPLLEESEEAKPLPEFTLEDALESVLITIPSEKATWRELITQGATDQQIRRTLTFEIGPGNRISSKLGICQLSVQPILQFWFGSYGSGEPTLKSQALIDKIREVLQIPWPKEVEEAGEGAIAQATPEQIGASVLEARGTCRVCGCTLLNACIVDEQTGETCAWTDDSRTLCTRCDTDQSDEVADVSAGGQGKALETDRIDHDARRLEEFTASLGNMSDGDLFDLKLRLIDEPNTPTPEYDAVLNEIARRDDAWAKAKAAEVEDQSTSVPQADPPKEELSQALVRQAAADIEREIFDDSASDYVVVGRDRVLMTVDEAVVEQQLTFQFDFSGLDDDDTHAIKKRTIEIRDRFQRGQELTIEIGEALRDVKRRLERGRFDEYLKREFGMSRDTADRLIGIKSLAEQSPHFAENVGKFEKSTQYLLIAPATPEEAKEEIIERVAAGEEISTSAAKGIVERHKPAEQPVEAEKIIEGRTRADLLTILKANAMQIEELAEMGFSPNVIESAIQERLIDRTVKGKCSYVWRVEDVVQFVSEQGSVSRLQIERAGCQIGAILSAEQGGFVVKRNGSWEIPGQAGERTAGPDKSERETTKGAASTPASTSVRAQYPGGNVRPEAPIEELLKGRTLTVSFVFGALPGKCVAGVRVGNDPLQASNVTLEASKVRGFPDAVQDLISKQLAGSQKSASAAASSGSGQKAASIRKGAAKKAPAKKGAVKKFGKTARQIAATAKRQAKRKPAAKKGAKR